MKYELLLETTEIYNITNASGGITYNTTMYEQAGEFGFTIHYIMEIPMGSVVRFSVDGIGVFYGYVFKTNTNNENITVTCYDQLRYFQNEDTIYFEGITAEERFSKICDKYKLNYEIKNKSNSILLAERFKNKSLFSMIQKGLDDALIATSNVFFVRDNFGVLEFINVNETKTDFIITEKSLLLNYDYEKSIDSDTYNRVKLVRDNKEAGEMDSYIAEDSSTQSRWGILQHFGEVDENANTAQIVELANLILKLKNRETQTISLDALGSPSIKAGSGFKLEIDGLIDMWVYCRTVDMSFEENNIQMNCEVEFQ